MDFIGLEIKVATQVINLLFKRLVLTLFISLSAISNVVSAADAQKEWLNGLLAGKDMSELSASDVAMNGHDKKTNQQSENPLVQYSNAEFAFIKDLDKLLKIESKFKPKHQNYLDSKFALLQSKHQYLKDWLSHFENNIHKNTVSKRAKIEQLNGLVNQRWKIINHAMKQPVESWNTLTKKGLNLLTNELSHKANSSADIQATILRNDRLPYGNRNFSSPALSFVPEIIPSYANELALAGNANDLQSDDVVYISPEIYELAADLEHDYIKIYNFVRQQITEQYYAGSMKGSQGTLLSYAGNDVDQAALLMALFRASNIPAHFVQGVIQQPLDHAVNGLGLTDANQVLQALNLAGIAHQPVIQGGQITAIQKQYTWISAYVPYAHYRGSANDLNDPVWIPLAPAIKSTSFNPHNFDYAGLEINGNQLVMDYMTGSDTNLNTSPLSYWKTLVEQAFTGSFESLIAEVENITDELNILPASLPFEVIATTYENTVLETQDVHQIIIELNYLGDVVTQIQIPLPQVSGSRVSLSYLPATVDDLNVINQAGGMSQVPPYLVDLRPVIKIDGKQIETNSQILPMAASHDLKITLESSSGSVNLERKLLAGTYLSLVLGTQNDDYPLNSEDINLISNETKPIRLLHNLGVNYNNAWNQAETELAAVMNHAIIRPLPSVVLLSPEYKVTHFEELPVLMQFSGVSIDAISRTVDVIGRINDDQKSSWMRISALQGSWLESSVFESQWVVDAISADKGIRILSESVESIHQINAANLSVLLPTITHPDYVKQHIESWVNTGHHALIPQNLLQQDNWQGSVWVIWHPETGVSGYFIAGGYAGGQTTDSPEDWSLSELSQMLYNPYAEGVNNNPMSGRNIIKVTDSDNQFGIVNQELLQPSEVLVTDLINRPVPNARVVFVVTDGYAGLKGEEGFLDGSIRNLEVFTNLKGVAKVEVKLNSKVGSGPQVLLNPADNNLTQLGLTILQAYVITDIGIISLSEPFRHYALASEPAHVLVNDCNWMGGTCDKFSSHQDMQSGNVYVVVTDEFLNPVSNVPISIEALDPVPPLRATKADNYKTSSNVSNSKGPILLPSGKTQTKKSSSNNVNKSIGSFSEVKSPVEYKFEDDNQHVKSDILGRCDEFTPAKIAINSCANFGTVDVPDCAESSASIDSEMSWSMFSLYNGHGYPATKFPIKISVAGIDDVLIDRYNGFEIEGGNYSGSGIFYAGDNYNGPNGKLFAGKINDQISSVTQPIYISYASDDTPGGCVLVQKKLSNIDSVSSELLFGGASLEVDDFSSQWPEKWLIDFNLGDVADNNSNRITAEGVTFEGVGIYPGTFSDINFIAESSTVSVDIVAREPSDFTLNGESRTIQNSHFMVNINPIGYYAESFVANFYENETLIYTYKIEYPTESMVTAVLPSGTLIDPSKVYSIEFILNEGADYEIKFDRQTIKGINRSLIRSVNCDNNTLFGNCGGRIINNSFKAPVRISTTLDFANQSICKYEGFRLDLVTAALVTIEAFKHDNDGIPTDQSTVIISDELLPAGENHILAQAETFGTDNYTLKITATAEDNGDQEEVFGKLISTYDSNNSLPIGHAIVKGVDLADGSMVYSKKDISLVSPGVDLEFVRTYSSQGRHELGPLGNGWAYNFMSRVIIGNCGIVMVTGADGGSARFYIDGNQFIPLKGFHSSLIRNEDGSFDFYPKGGNRYHYIKMQNRVWWMEYVEDPNGNRLTVELLPRNNAPIIRSVTDAVGRRLLFDYEVFDFGDDNQEVLVRVTGPEGIDLSFEYDTIGNLVSAKREGHGIGGSTDEMFTYAGDLSGPSKSLLESVTDLSTGATRVWGYQNKNLEIPPLIATVPDINSIEVINLTESDAGVTSFNYTPAPGYNSAASVNQNGQVSDYQLNYYGAANQVISPAGVRTFVWDTDVDVLLRSETDENSRIRSFVYDAYGNVTEERLGALVSTYTYHAPDTFDPPYIKDRVKKHSNWRSIDTLYSYDLSGNKVTETRDGISFSYNYNDMGLLTHYTDGRGLDSIFTYDDFGYQTSVRNSLGDVSKMQWNARGQKNNETDANGVKTSYFYDDSDRVIIKSLNDTHWIYDYQNGGKLRIETDPNQHSTSYLYDTQGRLLETSNAKEDTFTYVYDPNGNKISENDFAGHVTTFEYNVANRLEVKTEPPGSSGDTKVTTYTYDNVGNVLSETTLDRMTEYEYDPNRYFQTTITRKSLPNNAVITRTVDGNGNVLTEIDPMQNLTEYTYDAFDRMLTMDGPLGSGQVLTYDGNGNVLTETVINSTGNQLTTKSYDLANRLKQVTLPEGGVSTYGYDANGNIITETKPNGYTAVYDYNYLNLPTSKDINGHSWILAYDDVGNLEQESGPFTGGAITEITNFTDYTYDELNRQLTQSDRLGNVSIKTYDADSNLLTQTDGEGQLITLEYNDLHQLTKEIKPLGRGHTYTYTVFDELLTDTGPNGTITHQMDALGRRYDSIGPDDYHMVYEYDLNGNLSSQTDSRGIQTIFDVNELNQTESQTTGSFVMSMTYDTIGNQVSQTDYRGIVSEFTYDKENRQLSSTRAGLLQNTTTYNHAGLPVIIKDANGNNTVHEYNNQYHKTRTLLPESQIITFEPNALGDINLQNNPGPNDITRTFDARRRLKTQTNGAGEMTEYDYDLNNNRTSVVKPGGQHWEYDFDAANRLTHVRNVPESIETIYDYDASDNLKTITDAEQKITTFTYDDRNRKKSKIYPDEIDTVSYTYDPNSNLKTIVYPNGVNVEFEYDDLNRQYQQDYTGTYGTASVTMTFDGNGNVEQVAEIIEGDSYNYAMQYDDLNRMSSKTDRYGHVLFYTYDANGNRKLFRDHDNKVTNYDYDKLNRLKQLSQAGLGVFEWSYNSAGLPERIDYPNGSEANYSYDDANRIALIDNKQSGVTVTSHAYEYDLNGNRDKLTESNIEASQITSYYYDDADRLIQTEYPSYISTLTLDKVGNREFEIKDDPINGINEITYSFNNRDQLTGFTDTDGNINTYDYDSAGNQTEIIKNSVITTLTYSPRQRVSSIIAGAEPEISYSYDPDGLRVQKTSNGMTVNYLYDVQALTAETNTLGNTLARYHYSDRSLIAETRNGQNTYQLKDALGTTVAMTNQDGSVQVRYNYDVWGNRNNQTGSSDSPFGFTGYQLDETGLYYAQQRYYDPTTARFNREDPLQGNPQTPPSLHRYLYANANPTFYIDPDGRESVEEDSYLISYNRWLNFSMPDDTDNSGSKSEMIMIQMAMEKDRLSKIGGMKEVERETRALAKRKIDNEMMRVAESNNNDLLLELGVDVSETIDMMHIAACVYESARKCSSIRSGNYRRFTDEEYIDYGIDKRSLNTRPSGFKADLFINQAQDHIVFATAGTDSTSIGEILADALADIIQPIFPQQQYWQSERIARKLSEQVNERNVSLTYVGHSLGGGEASLNSIATGHDAYTFNAAGLGLYYQTKAVFTEWGNYLSKESTINAMYVQGEALSSFQDFIPGIADAIGRRIELTRGSSDGSVSQHGMVLVCKTMGENCDYSNK